MKQPEKQGHRAEKLPIAPPLLLFLAQWAAWALWLKFVTLPPGLAGTLLSDVLVKGLIWALPPLLLLWRYERKREPSERRGLFSAPFPWLPCLALLCASAAFLHTVRLLNGLQNTVVFFEPVMLLYSLSAGVLEELGFRGGLYTLQERGVGFWPAALLNGAIFTLYHYPELLLGGSWAQLLSLRALMIFIMGVVFCWSYHKWRNLALNVTVHTVWDLLSYLFCLAG